MNDSHEDWQAGHDAKQVWLHSIEDRVKAPESEGTSLGMSAAPQHCAALPRAGHHHQALCKRHAGHSSRVHLCQPRKPCGCGRRGRQPTAASWLRHASACRSTCFRWSFWLCGLAQRGGRLGRV